MTNGHTRPLHISASSDGNGGRKTLITFSGTAFSLTAIGGFISLIASLWALADRIVPPIAQREIEKFEHRHSDAHRVLDKTIEDNKRDLLMLRSEDTSRIEKSLDELKAEIRELRKDLKH